MTVLRNATFVDGSGRRYIDASVNGAAASMRIVDVDDLELGSLGHLQPNTNDAFA